MLIQIVKEEIKRAEMTKMIMKKKEDIDKVLNVLNNDCLNKQILILKIT